MSLSRDAGTGDYALEAGALVLADQGGKTQPELSFTGQSVAFVSLKHLFKLFYFWGFDEFMCKNLIPRSF